MHRFRALLAQKRRPLWMGILNVTPDSFSDGGVPEPVPRAEQLIADGADVIDIGGESTRPGAQTVSVEEELRRVLPVLTILREKYPAMCFSVDTRKSAVAQVVLQAGADVINDVSLLGDSAMAKTVASFDAGLILMHARGTPETMREARFCTYGDLLREVTAELQAAAERALAGGVSHDNLMVDPGIGFAKTPEDDWRLLEPNSIAALRKIAPVLLAFSRKSFVGKTFGIDDPRRREVPCLGISAATALAGADMIRIHDVKSHRLAVLAAQRIGKNYGN